MDRLHLEVSDAAKDGARVRYTHLWRDAASEDITIFHELERGAPLTNDSPLDGHVLVVLLFAASLGRPLRVHGPVSRSALRNMEELLRIWSRWRPDRYKVVDIHPDRVVDFPRRPGSNAISAFSGGLDATFLALRHAERCAVAENPPFVLRSALLVHGFDIDVYNSKAFRNLKTRIRPLIEETGLDLRTIRTNSRDLRLQDWDDSCGIELAGCLHMYSAEFSHGLIGSGASYEALELPWGSSPVTDHLMSGDSFEIIHDGAGFSRSEKAAAILQSAAACRTLKVCWAGADQAANCGRCEKCVRTQLNFLAVGHTSALPCFPGELDIRRIADIPINNRNQIMELQRIYATALRNNLDSAWVGALARKLAVARPLDPALMDIQKNGSPLKRAVVRLLTRLGIAETIKKIWRPLRRALVSAARG